MRLYWWEKYNSTPSSNRSVEDLEKENKALLEKVKDLENKSGDNDNNNSGGDNDSSQTSYKATEFSQVIKKRKKKGLIENDIEEALKIIDKK